MAAWKRAAEIVALCSVAIWPIALEGDDLDGYRRLSRAAGDIHIATGEQDCELAAFEKLITHAEVDVIQPDISRAGGITECRRIAAALENRAVSMLRLTVL